MDRIDLFRNLLLMAIVDGSVAESELRLLADRATEWGITDDEFEEAIQQAIDGESELTLPRDPQDRREMMKDMILVMAADGRLADSQKRLFALAAAALEMSADDLHGLIDEVLNDQCA